MAHLPAGMGGMGSTMELHPRWELALMNTALMSVFLVTQQIYFQSIGRTFSWLLRGPDVGMFTLGIHFRGKWETS